MEDLVIETLRKAEEKMDRMNQILADHGIKLDDMVNQISVGTSIASLCKNMMATDISGINYSIDKIEGHLIRMLDAQNAMQRENERRAAYCDDSDLMGPAQNPVVQKLIDGVMECGPGRNLPAEGRNTSSDGRFVGRTACTMSLRNLSRKSERIWIGWRKASTI